MIINELLVGGVNFNKCTATAADILLDKTAYIGEDELVTGTMPNNGAVNVTLKHDDTYTIPEGYHNGEGVVTCPSFNNQFSDMTATPDQIMSGKIAYINGGKTIGTMIDNGAVTNTLTTQTSYTIPKGYHNGNGKVTADIDFVAKSIKKGIVVDGTTGTGNPVKPFSRISASISVTYPSSGYSPEYTYRIGTTTIKQAYSDSTTATIDLQAKYIASDYYSSIGELYISLDHEDGGYGF